jgi:hypothetical protein
MAENLTQLQLLENEYVKKMLPLINGGDTEGDHWKADNLIIIFLHTVGCEELAQAFDDVPKWYS